MASRQKITSRDNSRLKHAKLVRDGKEKSLMFVEGFRLVEEAVMSDMGIEECFISAGALNDNRAGSIAKALDETDISVNEISDEIFRSISDTENPQGILLICRRPQTSQAAFEATIKARRRKLPLLVYLEEANNPSNLGAILRTAEAAGVRGIIISANSADVFAPKSLRASMGSAFRLPIWNGTALTHAVEWAKEQGMIATAADIDGDKAYTEIDWKQPRLLVFGSEAHGLSDAGKGLIQDLITIPIDPHVESLNLAVSAGIVLFEARRQQ